MYPRGEVPSKFSRQMGYTRREFLANLEAAMRGAEYHVLANGDIRIPLGVGSLTISLGPEQQRRIASLTLPAMDVEFAFEGVEGDGRRQFYESFQRSFQKGGG